VALDPIAQTSCPVPASLRPVRGDSISIQLRLVNAATGRPIVLTGWSGVANVYATSLAGAALHTMTVDVDQSAAGLPITGVVTISAAINATVGWTEFGSWALILTDGTTSKTIVAGPWELVGNGVAQPLFSCSSGSSAAGACGVVGFDVLGSGCSVLDAGYTVILLPHPQGSCSCA
jgi:hypothetical protein